MESSLKELAYYRMERAREMLSASKSEAELQLKNAYIFVEAIDKYLKNYN